MNRPGISWLNRGLSVVSLLAAVLVFAAPGVAAAWGLGWITRIQLLPAIFSGAFVVILALAVFIAVFGRLYCSILCPLGIAQDVVRFCLGWLLPKRALQPQSKTVFIVRLAILALFLVGAVFGFTGLIAPYGIFGRFIAVGIRRVGEPAMIVIVWAIALFGFVMAMSLFRARWWCNRVCPVGTLLGLVSRFSIFHVRVDAAKCVKCGLCAKKCDKGALTVRADKSIAVDPSVCVACYDCVGVCRKEALKWR